MLEPKAMALKLMHDYAETFYDYNTKKAKKGALLIAKSIDKQRENWGIISAKGYWKEVINEINAIDESSNN